MVHRRMRQLSLTETETFVNLAKHALETLKASDDEDAEVKDEVRDVHRLSSRYVDEANDPEEQDDDNNTESSTPLYPVSLKAIQSEPVFKRRRRKDLVMGLRPPADENEDGIEMDTRWMGPSVDDGDDMLQFVARSHSDVRLDEIDKRNIDEDQPSADETTQSSLLLC